MEKEKKGLFGRMLDFWKEKISMDETDGIGFWNGKETTETHFAEMGAVAALSQGETKRAFWEEAAETALEKKEADSDILEQEKRFFFVEAEKEEKEKFSEPTEEEKIQKKAVSRLFTAEFFREEKETEVEEGRMGQAFLWEEPEEEKEKRSIVPVAEEGAQAEKNIAEAEEEMPKVEPVKREERQEEMPFDIEKLMQQMTKKLWEERESCGRRLRG